MRPCSASWRTGAPRKARPQEGGRRTPARAGSRACRSARTKLLAPVRWPSAIYCAGANYADHAAEMARRMNRPLGSRSAYAGSQGMAFHQGVARADRSRRNRQDFGRLEPDGLGGGAGGGDRAAGQERAAGKGARAMSPATPSPTTFRRAIAAPAPNISETSPFKADWTKHKSFDGSCPLGPWIVPASDIGDPQNLGLKLWVNDVLKQDSNSKDMIFNLAEQIEQLSSGMTLHPGDLDPHRHAGRRRLGARRIPQGRRRGEALDREHRDPDQQDGLTQPAQLASLPGMRMPIEACILRKSDRPLPLVAFGQL